MADFAVIVVNAHAPQSLATGMGIVLYEVAFLSSFVSTASSGTKYETPVFFRKQLDYHALPTGDLLQG